MTAARRIRVVVAESHPMLRVGAMRALERDPAIDVVGEAEDGVAAIALALRLKPDVLVLELRLPGLGGGAVLERLRAELPAAKALVLSSNDSRESVLDAVAAGAAGYLSKRTTGEELRRAVVAVHGGEPVISPDLVPHLVGELSGPGGAPGGAVRPRLTAGELELLRLVADGLTDGEIAQRLYVSRRTVQHHLRRIREKTGLRTRSELARWAAARSIA